MKRTAAVLVTHNRPENLKCSVESIRSQTVKPDAILIVDNGSRNGSNEWLQSLNDIIYIRQPNLGSSGGFYTAMKWAADNHFDFIWCMEDDIIAENDCLERLLSHALKDPYGFSALAPLRKERQNDTPLLSEIKSINFHAIRNRKRYIHITGEDIKTTALKITAAAFEGLLVSALTVELCGLPDKDFFIWQDDLEYCLRLGRLLPILIITNAVIYKQPVNNTSVREKYIPGEFSKRLYGIRNLAYIEKFIFRPHLSPGGKVLSHLSSLLSAVSLLIYLMKNMALPGRINYSIFRCLFLIPLFLIHGLRNKRGEFPFLLE